MGFTDLELNLRTGIGFAVLELENAWPSLEMHRKKPPRPEPLIKFSLERWIHLAYVFLVFISIIYQPKS